MKTVVISGYYGYENIGDEALLVSIISALKSEMPDLNIIVLSADPDQTSIRYGVGAVNRFSLFAVLKALKRADLLISGGGSLLQDVTGPLTIPYYLSIVALARMMGKPVMFYAQGIGPVQRDFGRRLIRMIANKVDMITLRDSASAQLLDEIGVHKPPVEVTADPVFAINVNDHVNPEDPFTSLGLTPPERPVAGIFVRDWQGQVNYKRAVAGLADYLYEKGWQVLFIPMQYPVDIAPAREIAADMKFKPLVIEQALSLSQITGLVNQMDLVIGMRLHALIIATVCAVPMVGISYDPKVSDFLDSIGQPVIKELEAVTAEKLICDVETVINSREDISRKLFDLKNTLRGEALRNSRIAVKLLNGR